MGHLYENSNPERFQHLCQSLLTSSFPGLQCFPIGQPDGGRDGFDPQTKTVLQVKFKRTDARSNADWLITALEGELPKILRLSERGAERYIIATNARGTAHGEVGSIDRVRKWLDEKLPIPGICFWRDDIDRRFDCASTALKLKYSELLSLEEGIEVVLGGVLGANRERQQDAIRSFIAAQFESDRTVKFKQVNLSNDLLDLFIDVPVVDARELAENLGPGAGDAARVQFSMLTESNIQGYIIHKYGRREVYSGSASGSLSRSSLGAAQLLMSSSGQDHFKLVVLEGAPGQGKSTLAQYVCQMHRARYLQKQDVLDRLSAAYQGIPFRVPVKVDLRDYAAFLDGKSPFETATSPKDPRTLDVFLAQLIGYSSGGIQFDTHDVLSLLKNAPTLLFLDGLDEVADIVARGKLVTSIGEALTRWREFEADLQVVVTSRPSVFGRAPSFDRYGFAKLTLQNIDTERIYDYANKWVAARGLDDSERRDVKKILTEKLELAHIRDLTRNPMQLTILLSLIHQVGHSLPDQRTDLYGRYVDLFLAREADKSARVREHRAVLLGFIQHLSWVLQTQSESSKTAGSISAQGLQEMAQGYLRAGGHNVSIADDLFGGGLERIFVLVERIEGLYEFEVQPLREFYCARHLYSTAPVGTYREEALRGDRAQRFEALAANPFWLNVCRFYAGCCERGETGTLVLSLEEMIKGDDLAASIHARRVGLALLQDWVFSNAKYAQGKLIRVIFDDDGTQFLLVEGRSDSDGLRLDVDCGRDTLRDHIFEQLKTWPINVGAATLCNLIRTNGGSHLGDKFCELLVGKTGDERTCQLSRMFHAGAAADLNPERLWLLITEDDPRRDQLLLRISDLLSAEPGVATKIPCLVDEFTRGILDGRAGGTGGQVSALGVFGSLLGCGSTSYLGFSGLGWLTLFGDDDLKPLYYESAPADVRAFLDDVQAIINDIDADPFEISRSPKLWTSIAEIARKNFGETWSAMSIAIRTAGIRVATELPDGSERLFDGTVPICARARAARLRRGGTTWWLKQLEGASSPLDRQLWVGLVLMWASKQNLYDLTQHVDSIVHQLSGDEYEALRHTLAYAAASCELRADRKRMSGVDLRPFSNRTAVLVAIAMRAESSRLLFTRVQERTDPFQAFLKTRKEVEELDDAPSWSDLEGALEWARRITESRSNRRGPGFRAVSHMLDARLRPEGAKLVLRKPRLYRPELVLPAVMEVQRRYRPKTLEAVSREQDWTFE